MLKLLGGGVGGSDGDGKTRWLGKSFKIEDYYVTVEDTLAEGGFSLVFLVKGRSNKKYALKRMAVNNDQDLFAARQEIAITKALSDSSHSVTFLASSIVNTSPDVHEILILLELYTGGRVVDMMNARLKEGLSEEVVMKIFSDICEAVARLHHRTKPIIHRDLKVENILTDTRGNFVLCDYGSCTVKSMHPEVLGAAHCEEQIAKFTTMPYRAPEMVSLYSGNSITTKADIWALGCLLFKLCFFTTPFGEQPLAIVSGTFSIPDNSQYSESLHSLIRYMLEPDIDKRPNIWQVAEVTSQIRRVKNPIRNVFHSPAPPSKLPTAPRIQKTKATSTLTSTAKATHTKEKVASASETSCAGKTQKMQSRIAAIPRRRPHIHQTNSGLSHTLTVSPFLSHLQTPQTAAITTSLDSGLNKFAPPNGDRPTHLMASQLEHQQQLHRQQHQQNQQRRHSSEIHFKPVSEHDAADGREGLDQFGQPYFTTSKSACAERPLASDSGRDKFGHTPFVPQRDCSSPISVSSSRHSDEFGALPLTSSPKPSSAKSQAPRDIFGAQPFIPSTDAFGSTPFLTP